MPLEQGHFFLSYRCHSAQRLFRNYRLCFRVLSPAGGGRGWKYLAGAIMMIAPKYFGAIEEQWNSKRLFHAAFRGWILFISA